MTLTLTLLADPTASDLANLRSILLQQHNLLHSPLMLIQVNLHFSLSNQPPILLKKYRLDGVWKP